MLGRQRQMQQSAAIFMSDSARPSYRKIDLGYTPVLILAWRAHVEKHRHSGVDWFIFAAMYWRLSLSLFALVGASATASTLSGLGRAIDGDSAWQAIL